MNQERDPLTGLYNRAYCLAQLEQALAEAKQEGKTAAVLFGDIDQFASLNCCLGHHVGDVVLCELAGVIQRVVANKGTLCRIGGDDFLVVLPLASASEASAIAEQICDQLARQPLHIHVGNATSCHIIYVALTIGVASYPADGRDGESLLRAADEAMFQSKKNKRQDTINRT